MLIWHWLLRAILDNSGLYTPLYVNIINNIVILSHLLTKDGNLYIANCYFIFVGLYLDKCRITDLEVVIYDGFILLKCLVTDIHEPDRPKKVLNPRSCSVSMKDRPVSL